MPAYTRGRPRHLPLARAEASPERTRSRISSRSNSAIVAKMPQPSVGSARILNLVQADEVNAENPEFLQCVDQLSQAVREAVVAVDDYSIDQSFAARRTKPDGVPATR